LDSIRKETQIYRARGNNTLKNMTKPASKLFFHNSIGAKSRQKDSMDQNKMGCSLLHRKQVSAYKHQLSCPKGLQSALIDPNGSYTLSVCLTISEVHTAKNPM
jgi:hypothetical protein